MSRKDFVELCQLKANKKQTIRTVYFLQGAKDTLTAVNAVNTFAEVPEFKDFLFKVSQRYYEEYRVQQKFIDQR